MFDFVWVSVSQSLGVVTYFHTCITKTENCSLTEELLLGKRRRSYKELILTSLLSFQEKTLFLQWNIWCHNSLEKLALQQLWTKGLTLPDSVSSCIWLDQLLWIVMHKITFNNHACRRHHYPKHRNLGRRLKRIRRAPISLVS